MGRKLKQEKAITLIALIITIVVLLILAVVTIQVVSGNGIINHAENARDNYRTAQNTENTQLSGYEEFLDAKDPQNVGKKEIFTFTINGTPYEAEKGMTWGKWCESQYNTKGLNIGWVAFSGYCVVTERVSEARATVIAQIEPNSDEEVIKNILINKEISYTTHVINNE